MLLFLGFGSSVWSQPVLTSADITNYSSNAYKADPTGLNPGNVGENQTWDFGNVAYNPIINYTIRPVPLESVPFVENYPLVNFVQKADIIQGSEVYEYYVLHKLSEVGIETFANTTASEITEDYTADTEFFSLPMTYNSTASDTYQSSTHTYYNITERIYDGYGTLITPFGIFNNVIRYKTSSHKSTSTQISVRYIWILPNPYQPLMSANFDSTDLNFGIYFYDAVPLNNNEFNKKSMLSIYPNPTNSLLNIDSSSNLNFEKVVITDVLGKIILKKNQNTNQIDVSDFASGIYILEAFFGEKKYQQKFIKQ